MNNIYYYEYNKRNDFILPYIIAPLAERQDTIILGSKYIAEEQSEFINQINSEAINRMGARVVSQNDFFNAYITFVTDCKEVSSGRKGLKLTIGALIHKSIFAKKVHICRFYIQFLIDKFDEIFKIDLFNNGAEQFIFHTSQNETDFEVNIKSFYNSLRDFETIFKWKIKKNIFCKRISKPQFPSVIYIERNKKEIQLEQLMFFFEIVDKHINGIENLDVSTFRDEGSLIEIKPLNLNQKIKTVNLISENNKQYIEIYT